MCEVVCVYVFVCIYGGWVHVYVGGGVLKVYVWGGRDVMKCMGWTVL